MSLFANRVCRSRRGNVLLEFSLIAMVLFLLLAFIMDFGRATYSAQSVTQAADHIAREVAVAPLPANQPFTDLGDANIAPLLKSIYSEDFLAIDITNQPNDQYLLTWLDSLNPPNGIPTGNKLLIPLMIAMDSTQNANIPAGSRWLVYPGALVASKTAPTGITVLIPTVQYGPGGAETVSPQSSWLHVVELDPVAFQLNSPQRGMASVRVNYPFQAVAISGRYRDPNNPDADPASLQDAYIEANGDPLQPGQVGGPYSGTQGLGQQTAFTKTVRPFRRIVSGQGVYRREVFQ
jgi:hypothetical protein